MAKDLKLDKEIEEFRSQMEVPSTFEDGFTWTSLIGALFVGMLMVPGAIYMQLLAGQGVGPAAQWVTVILFIEVARRAHKQLRSAEVFVLFYMASAVMAQPFEGLLFNQFFVQSRAAIGQGVARHVPFWRAPSDPAVLDQRNFLMIEWLPAVALVIFQQLLGRLNSSVMSYGFFRVASDIERLPFPMAPVGAQGILALVEQQSEESGKSKGAPEENWRWRIFSVGGILGLTFGFLYMGLPALSEAVLGQSIVLFPIPFVDWTEKTANILPAAAIGISLNMGQLVLGMVMPFYAMVGSMVGTIFTILVNPILYRADILVSWDPGDDTVRTLFKNNVDFYFSFAIGISLALALIGFYQVYKGMRVAREKKRRQESAAPREKFSGAPSGRGDFPAQIILLIYLFTSLCYILLSGWLIDWHPGVMVVLVFFAYLYTPIISYVTTRLEGMVGQVVQIPFVREVAFILSGYTGGVKVWFLPVPQAEYGRRTVFWRQTELTGTKFSSIWKAELILVPLVMLSMIFFAQFIWRLNPIPSAAYPYAERMWELEAANRCIIYTSTLGRYSTFEHAFNPIYLLSGTLLGMFTFGVLGLFSAPTTLMYGVVRGLNQTLPHVVQIQFIGAMIGRFYFQKRFGLKWRQYVPVVSAGFSCGMGLITVFAVGVNFLAKSVINIPF